MSNAITDLAPRSELKVAITNQNVPEITEYVRHLVTYIDSLYRTNQFNYLEQTVNIQYQKLAHISELEKEKNPIPYQMGIAMGTLNMMKQVLRCYHQQEKILKLFQQQVLLQDIPHLEDIVWILDNSTMVRHGVLAKQLGINKSTLTGIIKQIEDSGLINITPSGKYKYYSLSDSGKRFANQLPYTFKRKSYRAANHYYVNSNLAAVFYYTRNSSLPPQKTHAKPYSQPQTLKSQLTGLNSNQLFL